MAVPPSSIPITTIQSTSTAATTTTNDNQQPNQVLATSAFRSFFHRLSSSLRQSFSQRRPWSELTDRTTFSRPESFSEATSRIRKNFGYFRVNYTALLAFAIALSLLTHPFSLLVLLCLLAAWIFLYLFRPTDQPFVILGRTFSDRETLVLLVLSTIIVVFLTNVGSVMISALLIGMLFLCVHGAFKIPEDLFLDDQEPANAGFLSFLGGTATSAVVAAVPAIPRV